MKFIMESSCVQSMCNDFEFNEIHFSMKFIMKSNCIQSMRSSQGKTNAMK